MSLAKETVDQLLMNHENRVARIIGAVAALSMGQLSDRYDRRPVLLWNTGLAMGFSFAIGWFVAIDPSYLIVLMFAYSFFAIGDSSVCRPQRPKGSTRIASAPC